MSVGKRCQNGLFLVLNDSAKDFIEFPPIFRARLEKGLPYFMKYEI